MRRKQDQKVVLHGSSEHLWSNVRMTSIIQVRHKTMLPGKYCLPCNYKVYAITIEKHFRFDLNTMNVFGAIINVIVHVYVL